MSNIKQLVFNQFKTFALLSCSIVFSLVLLMIKIRITHSFIYLFLVWNLFLAVIPFIISTYLISTPKLNKLVVLLWCLVWLLFLPNTPYIVTDLLHLNNGYSKLLWLDVLVISSFAFNGLVLFYYSLIDMRDILSTYIRFSKSLVLCILFLSSFGVYLGRFLRYNSWEIVEKPINLFKDIVHIIFHPNQNTEAWLFTLLFGTFLTMGYYCFSSNRAFLE